MENEYSFGTVLRGIIKDIENTASIARDLHKSGDIRESGEEIEEMIREMITLFLPERYLVKKGHIINSKGLVSPQFDIIIFDRLSTPKFFESRNQTVYYPIESVLAIGEIKLTLRKNHLLEFAKKIEFLKSDMERKLIENTVFEKINRTSLLSDIVKMNVDRKYRNPLFSFVFAVDVDDFEGLEASDDFNYMPNSTYILNYGSLYVADVIKIKGKSNEWTLKLKLEDEHPNWHKFVKMKSTKIVVLASLFEQLIGQLKECHIEPFSVSNYIRSNPDDFSVKGENVEIRTIKSRMKENHKTDTD